MTTISADSSKGKAGSDVGGAGGSSGPFRRYDDPGVLARVAALRTAPIGNLKQQWCDLFATEPPPFNRRYIESRLAYRIQELAFGGLRPETKERLRLLGEQLDDGRMGSGRSRVSGLPLAGTRLLRDWQGVQHSVTVLADGRFDWQGRPYASLSAIARVITGTRWNGWLFFGLKNQKAPAKGRGR